jgi:hypothetical protein
MLSMTKGYLVTLPKRDVTSLPISESTNHATGFSGDPYTKLLWTADERGINFTVEMQPWPSSRGIPTHTDLSQRAYAAGEAWRTGQNQLTINAASRFFGFNRDLPASLFAEARTRYESVVQFLRSLGIDVIAIPFGQRLPLIDEYSLTDGILTLEYWQAVVTFRPTAVESVLGDLGWVKKHPDVVQWLSSGMEDAKRKTILPGDIILAIASRDECVDRYYADNDGKRLYAVAKERPWTKPSSAEEEGLACISSNEAVLDFGAYCLFQASDKGVGYKGERDPLHAEDE